MQRLAVPLVRFADVNSHQRSFAFEFLVRHFKLLKGKLPKTLVKTYAQGECQRSTTTIPQTHLLLHKLWREAIRRLPAFSRSPIRNWKTWYTRRKILQRRPYAYPRKPACDLTSIARPAQAGSSR